MADVTNPHRQHRPPSTTIPIFSTAAAPPQEEEEFYDHTSSLAFDFDPFFNPNDPSNSSFFYDTSLDPGFDLNADLERPGCQYEDPNFFFFGGGEGNEPMNSVTDLLEPRQSLAAEDLIWDMDAGRAEEPDDEFAFGSIIGYDINLQAASIDSESDSEINLGLANTDDDALDAFDIFNDSYHAGENEREESDWEEVSERIHFDERENLNLVINGVEEISVSSDISSIGDDDEGTGEHRNLEWEVLLQLNNFEGTIDLQPSNVVTTNVQNEGNHPEDYIFTMEYDAVENEDALKGRPPASKSVIENLPSIVLKKEEMGEKENSSNGIVCAVCKDEFVAGEKGTKLPCCHLYHGDCIIPWLGIRNTCPVCRYELPTDDADYERSKNERVGNGDNAGLLMILR